MLGRDDEDILKVFEVLVSIRPIYHCVWLDRRCVSSAIIRIHAIDIVELWLEKTDGRQCQTDEFILCRNSSLTKSEMTSLVLRYAWLLIKYHRTRN